MQKYGELMHVHVDAMSPQGSVFVRCISAQIALNAVRGINTRSLAGALEFWFSYSAIRVYYSNVKSTFFRVLCRSASYSCIRTACKLHATLSQRLLIDTYV